MIEKIKDPKINLITTFRTGFIPQYEIGEIINIKLRDANKIDSIYCTAEVLKIKLCYFQDIPEEFLIEIKRYNRNFKPNYRFFVEVFRLIK